MNQAARDALYAAGIGGGTLAARLLEIAAAGGVELVSERYRLCALLEASESGLRYALKTLAAAGLIECQRSARGLVRFAVRLGARMHVPETTPVQRTLFTTEARRHGDASEEGGEAVGAVLVPPPRCLRDSVVNPLSETGVAAKAQQRLVAQPEVAAQRSCAALSRDVMEAHGDAPAGLPSGGKKPRVSKVVETGDLESLAARWPSLMEPESDPLAREVHSHSSIPPFPPPLAKARYSRGMHHGETEPRSGGAGLDPPSGHDPAPCPPCRRGESAGGNVEKSARAGIADPQGGKIAAWRAKILDGVKIDARYAWTAWSAALLAVEGPISEATLAGCIEGSRGHGGKFVNAVKARLAECDVGQLKQLTLWDDVTRTVQLHRFTHLRPALARHGIQLDDGATRLVRSERREVRRA